jgi:peptidoglycan hydrolase CwlO-like protein
MADQFFIGMVAIVSGAAIPVVAILGRVARQWMVLRAEQRALGVSSRDLTGKVERLEKANAEYEQRLQDLEAVVSSRTWNVLQESGAPDAERQRRVVSASHGEMQALPGEERNRQRTAELARRLGA